MVMLLSFFCVTAMPPSGLFISELMIFRALFHAHYLFVLVMVLFLLTVILWALGKNIFKLLFALPVGFDDTNVVYISPVESISQFIFLGLIVYLGINPPGEFVTFINEAIKNLPK
jgi:hydrogenase-4 component F